MRALDFANVSRTFCMSSGRPIRLNPRDFGAPALRQFGHALTEEAVDTDDHFLAFLNEIGQAGFHAGAAGSRDREGKPVPGFEHGTQQQLDLVHAFEIQGIHMAKQRRHHGLQDTRFHIARAGAEQNPLWWMK